MEKITVTGPDCVTRVAASPLPPRVVYWGKTLAKFVSAQLFVQALGIMSGILLVRVLDQREYAYFTIAFAMQSTMNILADSGVGIGLSSIGGRVWQQPERFGQLVRTALGLRRYLGALAACIITPALVWMLMSKGASGTQAALLTLTVLAGLYFQLTTGVLMIVPRLCSQIGRVQRLDLLGAFARLALLVVAYFLFLDAAVASLAAVVAVLLQYLLLRRWVADSIDTRAPSSAEDRAEMAGIIKSQAPNAVFYCLQGQLTVWLVGVFGNTKSVAEIGALARLSIIFSVVSAVMTSIVLPGFARCQSHAQLRRRYFQIISAFVLFGLFLVSLAALFPAQLLWVLGPKYAHLRGELLLVMSIAALNSVVAAMWSLNSTRAWIKRSWLNIPAVLATQALLLFVFDVSTLDGVLWFGIFSLVPTFVLNAVLSYRGLSPDGNALA
jgi:O-antigen/teichoic acid export membrane protein